MLDPVFFDHRRLYEYKINQKTPPLLFGQIAEPSKKWSLEQVGVCSLSFSDWFSVQHLRVLRSMANVVDTRCLTENVFIDRDMRGRNHAIILGYYPLRTFALTVRDRSISNAAWHLWNGVAQNYRFLFSGLPSEEWGTLKDPSAPPAEPKDTPKSAYRSGEEPPPFEPINW